LHHFRRKNALVSLLLVGTLALGVAACGGDDDDDVASSDTTEATADDGATTTVPADGEATGICADLPPSEEPADGATATDITAKEYEYEGIEDLESGGVHAVTFTNEGEEVHELFVGKIDPSETRTIDELMASEEQPDTVSMVAIAVACPGGTSTVNVDLSEPGRYVAICNVPVGTTEDADPNQPPSGPPHSSQGMVHEFTIS
jgi:hypothetical protein